MLDLLQERYDVFVLDDAVGSCTTSDYTTALDRMRHAGAIISSSQSIIFEMMRTAAPTVDAGFSFKDVSKIVKEHLG